jgi:hypothetical protein
MLAPYPRHMYVRSMSWLHKTAGVVHGAGEAGPVLLPVVYIQQGNLVA